MSERDLRQGFGGQELRVVSKFRVEPGSALRQLKQVEREEGLVGVFGLGGRCGWLSGPASTAEPVAAPGR